MNWRLRLLLSMPLLALLWLVLPSTAQANEFIYTYTYTPVAGTTFSFTTEALNPSLLGTLLSASTLTSENLTGDYATDTLADYGLDFTPIPCVAGGFTNSATVSPCAVGANLGTETTGGDAPPEDFFASSDYTTPGTYTGALGGVTDTLTVTAVATPEPSSLHLLALGVLGLAAIAFSKKRSESVAS